MNTFVPAAEPRASRHARATFPLLLALLAASGCSTVEVYTAKSPTASFTTYRTYAHGAPEKPPPGFTRSPLTAPVWAIVQVDVDRELAAKGYTLAPSGAQPDLLIRTGSGSRVMERDESAEVHGKQEWVGPDIMARYTQATLVMDVYDARTGQPIWHGSSRRALDPMPKMNEASVAESVHAILRSLPGAGGAPTP
jgi:hypothetical protein